MDKELKYQHEQFIQNKNGSGSPWEIFEIIIISSLSHILFESFLFGIPILRSNSTRFVN